MTQLIDILSSPGLASVSMAQQCLDWLNETTIVPGGATPYTWSGVAAKLIADIQSIFLQQMIGNVIGQIRQAIHAGTPTTVEEVASAVATAFAAQMANMEG